MYVRGVQLVAWELKSCGSGKRTDFKAIINGF